jgi:hypothetical protein
MHVKHKAAQSIPVVPKGELLVWMSTFSTPNSISIIKNLFVPRRVRLSRLPTKVKIDESARISKHHIEGPNISMYEAFAMQLL